VFGARHRLLAEAPVFQDEIDIRVALSMPDTVCVAYQALFTQRLVGT